MYVCDIFDYKYVRIKEGMGLRLIKQKPNNNTNRKVYM